MYFYIRGFADSRQQIISDLKAGTGQVLRRLIKIFLYPNAQEQNHWKGEVARFLYNVPKTKSNKKYPSKSFIYNHTWNIYEDNFDRWVDAVTGDMEETPASCDIGSLYNACEEYFSWLSNELSKSGIIRYNDSYSVVERIRSDYFTGD